MTSIVSIIFCIASVIALIFSCVCSVCCWFIFHLALTGGLGTNPTGSGMTSGKPLSKMRKGFSKMRTLSQRWESFLNCEIIPEVQHSAHWAVIQSSRPADHQTRRMLRQERAIPALSSTVLQQKTRRSECPSPFPNSQGCNWLNSTIVARAIENAIVFHKVFLNNSDWRKSLVWKDLRSRRPGPVVISAYAQRT